MQLQQSSRLTRPLRFSAAALGTAVPLVSFVLLGHHHCCLLFASAIFRSSSPYTSSATRIEAFSPSCQIVSLPHRDVQNTEPDTALLPYTNAQAYCNFRTATRVQETILHPIHRYSVARKRARSCCHSSTGVSQCSVGGCNGGWCGVVRRWLIVGCSLKASH